MQRGMQIIAGHGLRRTSGTPQVRRPTRRVGSGPAGADMLRGPGKASGRGWHGGAATERAGAHRAARGFPGHGRGPGGLGRRVAESPVRGARSASGPVRSSPAQREQVIEALWPHLEPDAGAANLRKAAHHARQALGREDAVVLSGGRVALFPCCDVETDVAESRARAEAALRSRDGAACAEAAARYAGDLLPDSLYEEWTQARRDQLRSLHVALLRLGGRWERLVEIDPSDEQAHRELMRAALAAGTGTGRSAGTGGCARTWSASSVCRRAGEPGPVRGVRRRARPGRDGLRRPAGRAGPAAAASAVGRAGRAGRAGGARPGRHRQVDAVPAGRSIGAGTRVAGRDGRRHARGRGPYAPLAAAVEQLLSRDRALLDALPRRRARRWPRSRAGRPRRRTRVG